MVIRFGEFELDQGRFELRRRGEIVPVQRRVLETILYLATRAGRLVTREELANGPWGGTVVGDAAIARAIKEARAALGDTGAAPSTIVTVRGVGFRFEAEVQSSGSPAAPARTGGAGLRAFTGRERELTELCLAWSDAQRGQGSLALVVGAPGIGKSTLVERFAEQTREGGGDVHFGRCFEAQGTPPYWPWPELLRSYAERHGAWRFKNLAKDDLAELASIAPTLASRVGAPATELAEGPYSGFRALDAVTRFLRSASQRRPLALLLEDAHLAEDAALDLIEHLQRSIADSRILLVVTSRASEGRERAKLRALLEGALPHARTLELGGLNRLEVSRWFDSVGASADAHELSERVARVTDGHPLLIANLLRPLPPDFGAADLEQALARALFIPDSLSTSIRAELERLDPDVIELTRTASVLGEEPWLPVLADLSACAPAELGAVIDRALLAGILERRESGRLRFRHALIREISYRDLTSERRLELHAAAVSALEARLETHPELVIEAAHHAMAASPCVKVDETVELLVQAATWARRRLAFGLAAEHLRWALQTLDLGAPAPHRRAELLLKLAQSLHLSGRAEEAVRAYQELYEVGYANHFGEPMAAGVLGDYEIRQEAALVDPDFHEKLKQVLALSWPKVPTYARLRAVQAVVTAFSETEEARMEWFVEAGQIVPTGSDSPARMAILFAASRMDVLNKATKPERLLPLAEEFVTLADRRGSVDATVHASTWRASMLLTLGRGDDFASEVSRLTRCSQRVGHPHVSYFPRLLQGTSAFLVADLERATTLAREAPEVGRSSVGVLVHSLATVQLFAIGNELEGDESRSIFAEAFEHAREVLAVAPAFEVMLALSGALRAHLGEGEAAATALSGWRGRWAAATFKDDAHTLFMLSVLSDVACRFGDRKTGAELYRALLPHSHLHVVASWAVSYCGPVSYSLGRLALALNEPDAASHFEHAIAESERASSRSFKAWSELGLACALSKRGGAEALERAGALREGARRAAMELALPRLLSVAEGRAAF